MFAWIRDWIDYRRKYQNLLLERDEALQNAIIINGRYEYICSNLPADHSMSTRRHWEDYANDRLRNENAKLKSSLKQVYEKFTDFLEQWRLNCIRHGLYMYKEWQPIDVAPQDGTMILCFEAGIIDIVRYENGHFRNRYNSRKIWEPTHWMALPEEPK